MMFLYDGPRRRAEIEEQIGIPTGRLFTPSSGGSSYTDDLDGVYFGIDNGCYLHPSPVGIQRLASKLRTSKDKCLFITYPDVVGCARRTLEIFDLLTVCIKWQEALAGYPAALVAQDGIGDLEIPWRRIDAIFIGGTDAFKLGPEAEAVVRAALILGKHVHVGRVNSRDRYEKFKRIGAHTFDGSGLSKFSDYMVKLFNRPGLPFEESHVGQS